MALNNSQYSIISRDFDNRRLQNKYRLDERREEIYYKIPAMKALDEQIAHESIKSAKLALTGDMDALLLLKKTNRILADQKLELLLSHGFPIDYLQPIYECKECKDIGYVNDQKCHCFKQAIVNLVYAQSNVQNKIEKENFSNFSYAYYPDSKVDPVTGRTPLANIKRVVQSAMDFIEHFSTSHSNLMIYGNTGVGKTFLSNCIAGELLKRAHTVIYFTSFQLFDILEKYKFHSTDMNEELMAQYEYILECDLLIIDDLGTELVNSFTASGLYWVINERHLRQKSMIISTNLSFDQLKTSYSERIFSRLISNYTLLKIIGEDIRLR